MPNDKYQSQNWTLEFSSVGTFPLSLWCQALLVAYSPVAKFLLSCMYYLLYMKNTPYVMRQASPVITVARLSEPCCIITFSTTGALLALSFTGYIDAEREYIIVAEAWRFAQKNTQTDTTVKKELRTKRRRTTTATEI